MSGVGHAGVVWGGSCKRWDGMGHAGVGQVM